MGNICNNFGNKKGGLIEAPRETKKFELVSDTTMNVLFTITYLNDAIIEYAENMLLLSYSTFSFLRVIDKAIKIEIAISNSIYKKETIICSESINKCIITVRDNKIILTKI